MVKSPVTKKSVNFLTFFLLHDLRFWCHILVTSMSVMTFIFSKGKKREGKEGLNSKIYLRVYQQIRVNLF